MDEVDKSPLPEKRQRARQIKGQLGPFETVKTSFDKGKDRRIEIVRVTPSVITYRLKGMHEEYALPHEVGFSKALGLGVGVNTSPRQGRMARGEFKIA